MRPVTQVQYLATLFAIIMLIYLKKDLDKINYFSVFSDGSTDASVTEQEAMYILFLNDGVPKVRYFSVESVKNANAAGIQESIQTAFNRFGVTKFEDCIVGLNADGANVSMGPLNGHGKIVKDSAPWLQLVHCFNHLIKLALKDTFDTLPFGDIDNMLMKLYYLYEKSPKRYRGLKELSEAYANRIQNPSKVHGTRWIGHKYSAMKKILENYGGYMVHLESLSHTDSEALKRSEILGTIKTWRHAMYPVYMAVYLDILSPIHRISLAMQQEIHDHLKVIKQIKEFMWIMAKLVILLEQAMENANILTNIKKFLNSITVNEEGKHLYQNLHLKLYNRTFNAIKTHYKETLSRICSSVEKRFAGIQESPIFKNIEVLLDTKSWPIDKDSDNIGDEAVKEISSHFEELLSKNNCEVDNIMPKWITLKTHMLPLVKNNKCVKYLDI